MEGIMNSINQELQQLRKQKISLEAQLEEINKKEAVLADSLKYFEKQMETTSTQKPNPITPENPDTPEKNQ